MGQLKNIIITVSDLYFDGYTPNEIAEWTGLSFEEVIVILDTYGEFV